MPQATRLIFCEREGKWAAGLRRLWPDWPVLIETRSPSECWGEAQAGDSDFVAIEATTESAARLIPWLSRLREQRPNSRSVVLASPELADWQWLWREAGAAHVVCCRRELAQVQRIAQRHLAEYPAATNDEKRALWGRLPWDE